MLAAITYIAKSAKFKLLPNIRLTVHAAHSSSHKNAMIIQ